MKICFLSGTSAWGGAEVHTAKLAQTLTQRGHQVTVVQLGHDFFQRAADRTGSFAIRSLPLARPIESMSYHECQGLLNALDGDVGVIVRWGLGVGSLRLDLAARRHFGRYLVIEHSSVENVPYTRGRHLGGLVPGLGLWWYQRFLLLFLRSLVSDRVICVSEETRKRLIRLYRVPQRKVVTVHNGIDVEQFRPDEEWRRRQRGAWGIPDDALVFGGVGRLSREKGFDLAIDALGQLVRQHPHRDMRLVLVGEGSEQTALREAAHAVGLDNRVMFPGFCARPWEAYNAFDFFVMPSRDEALPLALLEAMACGCCPIAMNVGGVGEVLENDRQGWLVSAAQRHEFVNAMAAALHLNADVAHEKRRLSRERVVLHFDAAQQLAELAETIEKV